MSARVVGKIIDLKGASGATYRFMKSERDQILSPMGGNFVYARDLDGGCEVVFVGEAPSLMTGARARWEQAVRDHGASQLFTRLNVTERVRRLEQGDILSRITPPMNIDEMAEDDAPH